MLPMVSTVDEFTAARVLLERELAFADVAGEPPRRLKLGVMVEVPSLLWQLDEIAARRTSCRSAPTTSCNISTPPIATTNAYRTGSTR